LELHILCFFNSLTLRLWFARLLGKYAERNHLLPNTRSSGSVDDDGAVLTGCHVPAGRLESSEYWFADPERAGALAKEKRKAAVCLSMSIVTRKDEEELFPLCSSFADQSRKFVP